MAVAKPVETRVAEAVAIRRQLADMGFPAADIADLRAALSRFAATGQSVTHTYRLPRLGVDVMLQLSARPHATSFARVRPRPPPA